MIDSPRDAEGRPSLSLVEASLNGTNLAENRNEGAGVIDGDWVRHAYVTDAVRAQLAVAELLTALGRDVTSQHLAETPRRVAASLIEMLTPREFTMTTFPNDEQYDELVLVRDIPFHSLCEHHMLPFHGVAHVGYVPGDRIVGLSKLARVVEKFASDLQVQERLTRQISQFLTEALEPRGVGVVLEAEHMCMTIRGAQAAGSMTTTTSFTGVLAKDNAMRRQFRLAGGEGFA